MEAVVVAIYLLILCLIIRYYYRTVKRQCPDYKFTYSILEIWCGIAGLTPTFLYVHYAASRDSDAGAIIVQALLIFLSQLAGMIIVKLLTYPVQDQAGEAMAVLCGAFIGLLIPVFLLIGFYILLIVLAIGALMIIGGFPWSMFVVLFALVMFLIWRNDRKNLAKR